MQLTKTNFIQYLHCPESLWLLKNKEEADEHYLSKKIRLERAIKRTNISLENIQNRIASQMTDKKKINLADYVIDNNYTINNLHKKIDFVIDKIISIK